MTTKIISARYIIMSASFFIGPREINCAWHNYELASRVTNEEHELKSTSLTSPRYEESYQATWALNRQMTTWASIYSYAPSWFKVGWWWWERVIIATQNKPPPCQWEMAKAYRSRRAARFIRRTFAHGLRQEDDMIMCIDDVGRQ